MFSTFCSGTRITYPHSVPGRTYHKNGSQTELTEIVPLQRKSVGKEEDNDAVASWELVMQFLGTPVKARLTSFPQCQFLDLYFP